MKDCTADSGSRLVMLYAKQGNCSLKILMPISEDRQQAHTYTGHSLLVRIQFHKAACYNLLSLFISKCCSSLLPQPIVVAAAATPPSVIGCVGARQWCAWRQMSTAGPGLRAEDETGDARDAASISIQRRHGESGDQCPASPPPHGHAAPSHPPAWANTDMSA